MMNLDWISVSEDLPKEDKEYFITDGKYYAVGYWRGDIKIWDYCNLNMGVITHWASFKRLTKEDVKREVNITYRICPVCGNKMFKDDTVCDICNVKFNFD